MCSTDGVGEERNPRNGLGVGGGGPGVAGSPWAPIGVDVGTVASAGTGVTVGEGVPAPNVRVAGTGVFGSPCAPTGVVVGVTVLVIVAVGVFVSVAMTAPAATVEVGPGVGVSNEQVSGVSGAGSCDASNVNFIVAARPMKSRPAVSGKVIRTRTKSLPPGGNARPGYPIRTR